MADKTKIEWSDASWNPIVGCSIVSKGCTNCYAMKHAARLLDKEGSHYHGTTEKVKGKAVWTGKLALAPERILTQPLRWTRPRTIFVNSMGDLFHEDVPCVWVNYVFTIMAMCPQHTFQILTKRPDRAALYMNEDLPVRIIKTRNNFYFPDNPDLRISIGKPVPNIWLGTSIEDQPSAEARLLDLLNAEAAVRFVSAEPLLGAIDLTNLEHPHNYGTDTYDVLEGNHNEENGGDTYQRTCKTLDWVIAGGESGPNARPMHPAWIRSLRDQCEIADVPFFFKQWGEYAEHLYTDPETGGRCINLNPSKKSGIHLMKRPLTNMKRVGKKTAGRILDGREHNAMPEVQS